MLDEYSKAKWLNGEYFFKTILSKIVLLMMSLD